MDVQKVTSNVVIINDAAINNTSTIIIGGVTKIMYDVTFLLLYSFVYNVHRFH